MYLRIKGVLSLRFGDLSKSKGKPVPESLQKFENALRSAGCHNTIKATRQS